jgi:hypothetical protein
MNKCPNCKNLTANPKFCTRSCAVTYNNKARPKRKRKQRFCKHCNRDITEYLGRRTTCDNCNPNNIDWESTTIGELKTRYGYQKHTRVRSLARQKYGHLTTECSECGYSNHIHICHIQAINSFPDETPIAVINSLSNLKFLCPNCHWEFDNLAR